MTTIDITDNDLIVRMEGWDKVWALKSQITIPLAHVRGAVPYSKEAAGNPWLRMPGTYLPGVITAGSYWKPGSEWVFWDVHEPESAIIVQLADEHYAKLVIEVENPAETIEQINRAIDGEVR